MNYNDNKYNKKKYTVLEFELKKEVFAKSIKADKMFPELQTLTNLNFYNNLLIPTDDLDMALYKYANFMVPIITDQDDPSGTPITLQDTMIVISLKRIKDSNEVGMEFHKYQAGSIYNCSGIFVPYNQFLINASDQKKPVDIDYNSGIIHKVYNEKMDDSMYGGRVVLSKTKKAKLGDAVVARMAKTRQGNMVFEKERITKSTAYSKLGKFVFFEHTNRPIHDALRIVRDLKFRAISWRVKKKRKRPSKPRNIKVFPLEYKSHIPDRMRALSKNALGVDTFANIEDMWVSLYRTGRYIKFFRELNGLPYSEVELKPGADSETYYKEVLYKIRSKLKKNDKELEEMYKRDELSSDPRFDSLNKFIVAIKGHRVNYVEARKNEYDSLLCDHYKMLRDQLLSGTNDTGAVVKAYGTRDESSDGVYCSLCGDVIVIEKNFLSAEEDTVESSGNLVPKNEMTDMYYRVVYTILSSYVITSIDQEILVSNILYRVYPIIVKAVEEIAENDPNTIDVIVTSVFICAIVSLSILEPTKISLKAFKDGTKKQPEPDRIKKEYLTEAKSILKTIKHTAIRNSTLGSGADALFSHAIENIYFSQVHVMFEKLMNKEHSSVDKKIVNDTASDVSILDLEGLNIFSAVKKFDNITKSNGAIIDIVVENFRKNGVYTVKGLLEGICTFPLKIDQKLFDEHFIKEKDNYVFKNKALRDLTTPYFMSRNELYEIGTKQTKNTHKDYDFKVWHMRRHGDRGEFFTPTVSVSHLSFISSYGLIKHNNPEVYFCFDYSMHKMENGVCSVCGYEANSKVVKADPKYSRLLEFYKIYRNLCPNYSDNEDDPDFIVGQPGEVDQGSQENQANSGLHVFNEGKCIECGYSKNFTKDERIAYFEKFKGKLLDNTQAAPVDVVPDNTITETKIMPKDFSSSYNKYFVSAAKKHNLQPDILTTLLTKPLMYLNSILITYFKYNGELYYYTEEEDEVLKYAKTLILKYMSEDEVSGRMLVNDEIGIGSIKKSEGLVEDIDEEALYDLDDATFENGEDEPEEDPEDTFDLAPDAEDRFDEADAE